MAFTLQQFQPSKPEEYPFNDLVGKLLGGYTQGTKAHYLPQMQQADIFAKKIGPLATLATSPMFLQNPQFQAALGDLISKNIGYAGSGFGKGATENTTYAGQANKDIQEAGNLSNDLTEAGRAKTGLSSLAGKTENYLGSFGKYITELLSGGTINSELAQKQNRFENILKTLKNNAIQTQRLSPQDAEDTFTQRKNETAQQALKRIKRTMPSLFEQSNTNNQQDTSEKNYNDQIEQDNDGIRRALDIAEQIYQRTGRIVSENLIFNYMQNNPGPIHMPSLLKAIGEK